MRFALYCLCGGIGVVTDYLVYYFALTLGIGYQVANVLGYASGTFISFVLNRKITFGVHDQVVRRLVIFVAVAAVGYTASVILLWLFVEVFFIDAVVAKLATLPVVVIIQFSLNRRITFSTGTPAATGAGKD